jgi:hypothetical protein
MHVACEMIRSFRFPSRFQSPVYICVAGDRQRERETKSEREGEWRFFCTRKFGFSMLHTRIFDFQQKFNEMITNSITSCQTRALNMLYVSQTKEEPVQSGFDLHTPLTCGCLLCKSRAACSLYIVDRTHHQTIAKTRQYMGCMHMGNVAALRNRSEIDAAVCRPSAAQNYKV